MKSEVQILEKPKPLKDQVWSEDVEPLVSISCITYNHEKFISDAIEGFLMQETTFPVEINIHDDASTDNTAKIVREYEKKYPNVLFNVIYQTENQYSKGDGSIRRIQHGRARGKYYAMCEGDDYWIDPLKLQKQAEILEENENVGIVHTGFIKYDMINDIKEDRVFDIQGDPLQYYLVSYKMKTATVMLRTKLLDLVREIKKNSIIKGSPYGDRVTFLTIAAKSDIIYMEDITSVYRIFPGESATRHKSPQTRFELRYKMTKVDLELMKKLNIKNNKYKLKTIFKRVYFKTICTSLNFKIIVKIHDYMYYNLGLGAYGNSKYY